jgi:NAD(P)-dependent dehydrogenase (short-subunit alcohol dehydrogenase family)
VFFGIKYAIPAMVANGGGSIINLSSIAGIIGSEHVHMAYNASKAAVRLMTKSVAVPSRCAGPEASPRRNCVRRTEHRRQCPYRSPRMGSRELKRSAPRTARPPHIGRTSRNRTA